MKIERLDHLVLTVKDIAITAQFYVTVLGMEKEEFGAGRLALTYGNQKSICIRSVKSLSQKQTSRHQGQLMYVSL